MATDITRKRLTTKGLQTRRLGGAIPRWELFSPEKGYSYGQFGMSDEKEKRIRAKAQATAAEKANALRDIDLTPAGVLGFPMSSYLRGGVREPLSAAEFVFKRHGNAYADWAKITPYLSKISEKIKSLKKTGQWDLVTPSDLYKVTGVDVNRAGGWKMLGAVLAAAEHPEFVNGNFKEALGHAFSRWLVGGNIDEKLGDESVSNAIKQLGFRPELEEFFLNPNDAHNADVSEKLPQRFSEAENKIREKEIERRAKKWEGKHGELAEQDYVEGLVGSGEYDRKESPHYQQAQKERREQNLDEYMARGQGTPSQKKRAKWRNPDLYAAGYPDGQQTEIPEQPLLPIPKIDLSKIKRPEKPDFNRIIDPKQKEEAISQYNKELDLYDHEVNAEKRPYDMATTHNDKVLARQKAMQKEAQQLLAENAWKDNLIMQRKLLKDKKKEYAKAKYQRSKEKNKLGGHDFWNVMRGVGGSAADSVGSIGGITGSLAAANRALKQGPQDWRNM
jgi:hypothetical protein